MLPEKDFVFNGDAPNFCGHMQKMSFRGNGDGPGEKNMYDPRDWSESSNDILVVNKTGTLGSEPQKLAFWGVTTPGKSDDPQPPQEFQSHCKSCAGQLKQEKYACEYCGTEYRFASPPPLPAQTLTVPAYITAQAEAELKKKEATPKQKKWHTYLLIVLGGAYGLLLCNQFMHWFVPGVGTVRKQR